MTMLFDNPTTGQLVLSSPLVGREEERLELEEILQGVVATGKPRAVTIIGSAGIGKTRLVNHFLAQIRSRDRGIRIYRGRCREKGPAFGVIQRILRARFGIFEASDRHSGMDDFRRIVAEVMGHDRSDDFLHFLGAFLDYRFPDSAIVQALEEDPEKSDLISRAALRRFLEVDAQSHPMVLVVEDLHLAQDDSLDLMHYLIRSLRDAPVLLLIVSRPELLARRADWLSAEDVHHKMELAPLGPEDAAMLMAHLLRPTGDPPSDLIDEAVDMAGGSPYLLEQMVRAFHQNGTLVAKTLDRWEVHLDRLDDAQLPLSVEDAITARIASLTPAERALLEQAASMGGVFWLGGLVTLARIGKPTPQLWGGHDSLVAHLEEVLATLSERDYILEMPDASIPGEREFAFKHNLERETLYRLTNQIRMRRLHLVIAEWLEFRLRERGEEQCEMLAQHYEEGGAPRQAAQNYLRAGDRARSRYANAKAAEYYARGLELLGDDDVALRIDALHHYGDVLQLAGRNEEALDVFRRMLDLAYRLDLKAKGGAAHNRIGRLYRAIGHLDDAMRHLGTGLALFDAAGDEPGVAASHDDIGKVHWMRGAYAAAERYTKKALEMRRDQHDLRSLALSWNNLGIIYQDSGRFAEALTAFHEALSLRQQIGDRPGIAQTLNNLGTIHGDKADHHRAVERYREALAVAREVGDRMRQAVVLTNLGESCYRLAQPEEAIRLLEQAEDLSSTLGDWILEGEILRGLAKAHLLAQYTETAHEYIERSIALLEKARGKPFLGVALRTKGEIAAASAMAGSEASLAAALESFEASIALFEELGNDIELQRSCEVCADFRERCPQTRSDPESFQRAAVLRLRAEEVRDKLRESEVPPFEDSGERTHPMHTFAHAN